MNFNLFLALLIALVFALGVGVGGRAENALDEGFIGETEDIIMVEGNTLKAVMSPAIIPTEIMAIMMGNDYDLKYDWLIECLEYYESKHNELAKGDKYYKCNNVLFESPYCAFGSMQFWQETFKNNCYRYGLTDIWSKEESRLCADLMIQENWNNVYQWSTAKKCI